MGLTLSVICGGVQDAQGRAKWLSTQGLLRRGSFGCQQSATAHPCCWRGPPLFTRLMFFKQGLIL